MSNSAPGSPQKRQLRDRKERKAYVDDWALGEDELDGKRSFNLQEKLESENYSQSYVREMNGSDLTITYLQRHGFSTPLLFKEKTGLGLHVPSSNFTVNDVRTCVGSRRMLDVMDVGTQKNFEMPMKEWQRYYEDPNKDKLLNVISLEFSHTKLENYIHTPSIVRQIDWVDCVWPRHLKEAQTDPTNVIDEMFYPKVQKYCLMSVKGCYTDFHIDFGGSSVWYHILRGAKVFWLIPPTEHNIKLYEQWVLSGKQGDIFFGDTVEKCSRITLNEGNTFFIPSGWIHAVFTPKDSLVFGGNFLHSFSIDKQIRVANVEEMTKVAQKFRYPFFTEMLWYVLCRYIHVLLGRSHLRDIPDMEPPTSHLHLTPLELHGIKAIVTYLHKLPNTKKNIPDLITDPVALIKDIRTLVEQHRHDLPDRSITGFPIISNPDMKYGERRLTYTKSFVGHGGKMRRMGGKGPALGAKPKAKAGPRRRRTRCKKCAACHQNDCGECVFCQDMVKFGGSGRAKQTCIMRQCLQPMLPVTAACSVCGLDGWGQQLALPVHKLAKDAPSSLMECSVCYEIVHPDCVGKVCPDISGQVNEDLPNSWECPKCVRDGKNSEYRPRHFRARRKWDQRRKSAASEGGGALKEDDDGPLTDESDSDDEKPRMAPGHWRFTEDKPPPHKMSRCDDERLTPPPEHGRGQQHSRSLLDDVRGDMAITDDDDDVVDDDDQVIATPSPTSSPNVSRPPTPGSSSPVNNSSH
ncbi:jmjC domain-containing histone demethylation protein [Nesidiocoris tenuis]|uniref:JmjC domain-containing histone demethylation protein n=1 Tax=Nesidiocoris tenuis TaxID=355587 RepID=A0ABN7AJ84_9HEMI|nr:jmjC domain-containing histone demethylation protein [Nesidiocoris tenuis]